MEGWLDEEQPDSFVEVIGPEGETWGWMSRSDMHRLNYISQTIEEPERYLKDPYIRYHAQLINERLLFKDGRDLNDVQMVLLSSELVKRREIDAKIEDRRFEESMFINNAELYRAYMDKKKQQAQNEGGVQVEQRVPASVEEFLAALGAFSEGEDETSDKGQEKAEGWLTSLLSDSDLDEMQDD